MANISKIKAQGSNYDIEDTVARSSVVAVTSKADGTVELTSRNSTVTLPSLTNFGDPSELENDVVTEISDLKSEISDFGGGKISESLKNILENMMTLFSAVSFFNDNVDVASIGTETNELINSLNVIIPDLTGITAVFNQTGIIYSDATLNDLKQYLTVTGSYADGTTREITDYSLDGTIAVGIQTITVASGNFTDTFTVVISNAGVWYELPAEVTLNASNYIMTGIRPFEEDVNFTIFAQYTNSGSNAMYGIGDVSASSSPMAGGGKSTGNTTIYINGTRFVGSSYTTKLALTHAAGSNVYKTYFSKTGTERNLDFTSYSDELRIGGYLKNRTDLAFKGTVSRFIVYRKCLTDAEIATVWDGGTV